MRLFVIVLMLLNSAHLLAAEQEWDTATRKFVAELFESPDFVERWRPVMWEQSSSERNDPNGGYIFRFAVEFDEESSFLFVGTDRFAGPSWSVYSSDQQGNIDRVTDPLEVRLDPRQIYFDSGNRRILQHHPTDLGPLASRDPAWSFSVLTFNDNGTITEEYFAAKDLDDESSRELGESGELISPKIEKVPLAAYLQAPNIAWSPLNSDYGFVAQSLDPSDANLLQGDGKLPLDDAKELARENRSAQISSDRRVGDNVPSEQLPRDDNEGRSGERETEVGSKEVEDESNAGTWPLVIGAIAVLGVAVILIRAFLRGRAS